MNDTERLYKALLAVFGDSDRFTAADVLRYAGYVAQPEHIELRAALDAVLAPKAGVIKIGRWLGMHKQKPAGELNLSGDYDTHNHRWRYCVFRMATAAECEASLRLAAEAFAKRRAEAMRRGPLAEMKFMDKELERLEDAKAPPREHGRAAYYRREREAKAAKEQREREAADREPKSVIYVSPQGQDGFTHEKTAQRRAEHFKEKGFNASLDFVRGGNVVIRIDGSTVERVTPIAHQFGLLNVREVTRTGDISPSKPSPIRHEVWDQRRQIYIPQSEYQTYPPGYDYMPGAAAMRRATADPPPKRVTGWGWSPFDPIGRTGNAPAMLRNDRDRLLSAYGEACAAVTNHIPKTDIED